MKSLAILYTTGEGHTVTISQEIRAVAERKGYSVELWHVDELPEGFHLELVDGIVLAASVHMGAFQKSMIQFVRSNLGILERTPSAFLSVSLTEADPSEESKEEVSGYILNFLETTGWHPIKIKSVAGALLFEEYGFFKRTLMRWIAKSKGLEGDTDKNLVFTDWESVDHFAEDFLELVENHPKELDG